MPPREWDEDDPRTEEVAEERKRMRSGEYQPTDRRDGFGDYGYSPPDAYDGRPV